MVIINIVYFIVFSLSPVAEACKFRRSKATQVSGINCSMCLQASANRAFGLDVGGARVIGELFVKVPRSEAEGSFFFGAFFGE